MELVLALILFVGLLMSWLTLPGTTTTRSTVSYNDERAPSPEQRSTAHQAA